MTSSPLRSTPRPSIPLAAWCAGGLAIGVMLAEELTWRWHGGVAVWTLEAAWAGATVAAMLLALRLKKGKRNSVGLLAAAVAAGLALGSLYWVQLDASARDLSALGTRRWTLTVVSDARKSEFGSSSLVRLAGTAGSSEVDAAWPSGIQPPPQGSLVEAWGAVTGSDNPATARDLRRAGHAGRLTVRRVTATTWAPGLFGVVGRVRSSVRERIAKIPGNGGALLLSTLLGDRSRLEGTPIEADLQTAGLSHFAATSGYHAVLVMALLGWLAAAVVPNRRLRVLLVLVLAGSFVVLCGARVPVVRGWSAAALAAVGWDTGRRSDGLAALAAVAAVFVCVAPQSVFDVGFALCVLGVAGILLFARLAEAWLTEALPRRLHLVSGALAVTTCAVLATLPVSSAVFGQVSLVAPLANLLAAPLVACLLVLGLCGVLVGSASVPVGSVVLHAGGAAGGVLASVASWAASLPRASIAVAAQPIMICGWILCIVVAWVVWPLPTRRRARGVLTVAAALVAVIAIGVPSQGGPRIVVMDIGQGDAILVADGGHNLLIDTGPSGSVLRAALGRQGVRALDGVVLTHYHADHYGGLSALRGVVRVPEVYVPAGGLKKQSRVVDEARMVAVGGRVEELVAGDRLNAGSIEIDVLAPLAAVEDPATNEASVVVLARRGDQSVLLTGDAESGVLEHVAQAGLLRPVDVLKVGHHGSAISLDRSLLDVLTPRAAVISVGAGNRYGHPRPEPLALLAERGIEADRTDLEGDVTILLGVEPCRVSGSHRIRAPQAVTTTPRALARETLGCAKLRHDPLVPMSKSQERDVQFAGRPQAHLSHLRNRGPPSVSGADAAQEAS
jgi:competence protein ComEC